MNIISMMNINTMRLTVNAIVGSNRSKQETRKRTPKIKTRS